MALTKIEKGTLADSTVVNDNFEYLDDRISSTAYQLEVSDATILSTLNSQISSVNETINELTDSLSDVADDVTSLDTSNSSKISATVSKSSNGYCKFSNGVLLQWGSFSSASYRSTKSITFPSSYGTTVRVFLNSNYKQTSGDKGSSCSVTSLSTTGFTYYSGFEQSSPTVYWFAIGY